MYIAQIRFLGYADLDKILELNKQITSTWTAEIIASDLSEDSNEGITYIGAFSSTLEERLLGYAVLGIENNVKKCGVLMLLLVDRNYFRMGIATQLMIAISDCASYLRYKKLKLRVRKSNRAAISLYSKLNFRKESVIEGYYSDGEDAYMMVSRVPIGI